jgi:predicted Zn finger-like uncharacterized protein
MDVRCERCETEYELEDSSVSEDGTQVQCTACGHTFVVMRPSSSATAPEPDSPPPAEWLLETADGQAHRFRNLTSLQKWIIERKVTREDRISRTGHAWRRLGEIVELAPFFDVVDEADRARAAALTARNPPVAEKPRPQITPRPLAPMENPIGPVRLQRPTPVGNGSDELAAQTLAGEPEPETQITRLSGGTAFKLVLVLGVAGGVAYFGIAEFWKRPSLLGRLARAPAPAVVSSAPPPRGPTVVPVPSPPPAAPPVVAPEVPPPAAARPGKAEPVAAISYESAVAEADRLLENGLSVKARRLYEAALKLKPGGAEALAGLGYVALDRAQTPQAFSFFKKALAQNASFGPALFGLAEAHRASGDEELALEHYRRYVSVDPGGTDVQAARRQIKTIEAHLAARGVPQPAP